MHALTHTHMGTRDKMKHTLDFSCTQNTRTYAKQVNKGARAADASGAREGIAELKENLAAFLRLETAKSE